MKRPMGNMQQMMAQVQRMQAQIEKKKEELKEMTVEATSGGGMVTATMSGDKRLVSIKIDPAAVDPEDVEMLEDMVTAAVNEAITKAVELEEKTLGSIAGGIPGLI
jgi:DNA-binding YbaB/EbfC family protein